jgi:hypothetical protein
MITLVIFSYFFGGGIGGVAGGNDALTFSVDFGNATNPTLDFGTKLTMSFTGNAPSHYDIPFYYWGDPGDYPDEYFAEYRERNEVAAHFVARKYLSNFILIGLEGVSLQEYIYLPIEDSLPSYPLGERDEYHIVYGAGMGIRISKFDFCLTFTNRFGALFYVTREFGFSADKKPDERE